MYTLSGQALGSADQLTNKLLETNKYCLTLKLSALQSFALASAVRPCSGNQTKELGYLLLVNCKCLAFVGVSYIKLGIYFYIYVSDEKNTVYQ